MTWSSPPYTKVRYRIKNCVQQSELKFEIKGRTTKIFVLLWNAAEAVAPGETIVVEGEFQLDPGLQRNRTDEDPSCCRQHIADRWQES